MKYCSECGSLLEIKECDNEGLIPFCEKCNKFIFPVFNVAVSMIILNKEGNKTLFIKQYGKDRNVLVAGYVNKGESAEEAVYRELEEEIGVRPISIRFQISKYWKKSNTLLFNYVVVLEKMDIFPNWEIDSYGWYDLNEACDVVYPNGLAYEFYKYFYDEVKNEV